MDQTNQNQPNQQTASSSTPMINPQSVAIDQKPPSGPRAKKWLLPLIIALVVLLAGGGALAYFYFYNPPDKIVQKMMVNAFLNIKSLEYEGEIKSNIDTLGYLGSNQLYATLAGAYDELDPSLPVGRFSLVVKENSSPQAQTTFSLETIMNFQAFYFSLGILPDLGFFDLSSLLGKWVRIDLQDGGWQKTLAGMSGIYHGEDEADPQDVEKIIKAKVEKLKKEVAEIKILSIDKKLPSENINGVDTHHYAVSLDPDGLKKLAMTQKRFYAEIIEEMKAENWEPGSYEDSQWTVEDENNFNKFVSENKIPSGEIWIGKKDLMPYRITMNFEVKGTNPGAVNLDFRLKNFNQPVEVDLPAEYISLEEILGGLLGGFAIPDQEDFSFEGDWPEGWEDSEWNSGAIDADFDFNKDNDGDGLTDYEEIYIYGTDPFNPDTDGDGYLDGAEVVSGYNPLGPGTIEDMISMSNPLSAEFWQQVPEGFFFLAREEIEQALRQYQRTGLLF